MSKFLFELLLNISCTLNIIWDIILLFSLDDNAYKNINVQLYSFLALLNHGKREKNAEKYNIQYSQWSLKM